MNLQKNNSGASSPVLKLPAMKVIVFELSFWVVGVALAFWFGLGWFFLLGTIRRLFIAVPWLYVPTVRILLGEDRAELEKVRLSEKGPRVRWHYTLQAIIMMAWVTMTIVAFRYANIRLADFVLIER